MLIALIIIGLLTLVGGTLGLLALGAVLVRLDGLVAQTAGFVSRTAEDAEENVIQHRITRAYIGNNLLEKKLLPFLHCPVDEPKTEIERWQLETWQKETAEEGLGGCH